MTTKDELLDRADTLLCSPDTHTRSWLEKARIWLAEKRSLTHLPWWHWSRYFGSRNDQQTLMKLSELAQQLTEATKVITDKLTALQAQVAASADPDVPQPVVDAANALKDAAK
jgi:hypothetical protein